MILDFVPKTGAFTLRVKRGEADVKQLMQVHGLDLSLSASTPNEALLYTKVDYAAAWFQSVATSGAKQKLAHILAPIDASRAADCSRAFRVPPGRELWPFQRSSVAYALERKNTLLGDQPGLGKTEEAIVFCNEIGARNILVICPANIRLQWHTRIQEWSTMQRYSIHAILKSANGVLPKKLDPYKERDGRWTIVSYDLVRAGPDLDDFMKPLVAAPVSASLAEADYDVIILDEIHYLKTTDSQRTRAVFGGGKHHPFRPFAFGADRIIGLSGTPLPNRPREAYTIARALCWDSIDWMSEDAFRARFNPSKRGTVEVIDPETGKTIVKQFVDERTGRHGELQNRLRAHFMTRHEKRDVMPQLKMPVYDLIQVEETGPVKQALEAERLLDIDPEDLSGVDAETMGHIASARRMMGVALAPQVANWIDMLIAGGEEKIVLFAWHIEVLNILQARLGKYGLIRIDGSTSPSQKAYRVQQFIKDPSINIALGNILSMGTGTDGLQEVAWHALIAEPSWTYGENVQCFDRLDRGGQRLTVQGDIFVAPGSIAEKVLGKALTKGRVVHSALDETLDLRRLKG